MFKLLPLPGDDFESLSGDLFQDRQHLVDRFRRRSSGSRDVTGMSGFDFGIGLGPEIVGDLNAMITVCKYLVRRSIR